jgi:serine/threonine-protein phosphatase 2A regulatory subunit A
VLPVVISIGTDRAWRVRWSLACNIFEISKALGDQMTNNTIYECFDNLLRDSEAEVSFFWLKLIIYCMSM